jgi:hypothetical protein
LTIAPQNTKINRKKNLFIFVLFFKIYVVKFVKFSCPIFQNILAPDESFFWPVTMLPKKKSQKVDFETGISYEVVEEDGEECDELEEDEDYLLTVSITGCK